MTRFVCPGFNPRLEPFFYSIMIILLIKQFGKVHEKRKYVMLTFFKLKYLKKYLLFPLKNEIVLAICFRL